MTSQVPQTQLLNACGTFGTRGPAHGIISVSGRVQGNLKATSSWRLAASSRAPSRQIRSREVHASFESVTIPAVPLCVRATVVGLLHPSTLRFRTQASVLSRLEASSSKNSVTASPITSQLLLMLLGWLCLCLFLHLGRISLGQGSMKLTHLHVDVRHLAKTPSLFPVYCLLLLSGLLFIRFSDESKASSMAQTVNIPVALPDFSVLLQPAARRLQTRKRNRSTAYFNRTLLLRFHWPNYENGFPRRKGSSQAMERCQ